MGLWYWKELDKESFLWSSLEICCRQAEKWEACAHWNSLSETQATYWSHDIRRNESPNQKRADAIAHVGTSLTTTTNNTSNIKSRDFLERGRCENFWIISIMVSYVFRSLGHNYFCYFNTVTLTLNNHPEEKHKKHCNLFRYIRPRKIISRYFSLRCLW